MSNPFRWFNSSPEVIRLVVMMYVRYPLSLRNVEDLLFERGIDICHETVRLWWNRFGPMFAGEIRRKRVAAHAPVHPLAMASRRGLREDQRRDALPLARGRSRGRGAGILRHQGPGQGRGAEIHQEGDEAPRPTAGDRHRRPALLRRRDEGDRQRRIARRSAAGSTTGPRTHTCPSDDESGRCCGSGG